jgi:hypothetical protein
MTVAACGSALSSKAPIRSGSAWASEAVDGLAHPEPEIERHLVVARARGVQPPGGRADQLGEPASTFMWMSSGFTDADGKPMTLADFKGQIVVVNLWATWCAPCRLEMPTLAALQAAYQTQPVQVVAHQRRPRRRPGPGENRTSPRTPR